ncbi:MAG: SMI1/KNR4 family protein [Pseudomonadota bacterium]|nr:SMI1/KNR4 family protein [Pseudomonadota bacterium]
MNKITQHNPYGATTENDVAAFEKSIGYRLPETYRQYLLNSNGGEFENDFFMPSVLDNLKFTGSMNTLDWVQAPKPKDWKTCTRFLNFMISMRSLKSLKSTFVLHTPLLAMIC